MTVFRWIIAVVGGLFAAGSLGMFLVYMASGEKLWMKRTRHWRRLAWASALIWFNVEIWRRVALVIVNW